MDEISKTCADKEPSPNDVLTQALDTQESSGRCKTNLEKEEMNATTKVVKEEVNVDVIILNDQQEDAIDVRNEKEVIRDFNIKMSLPLKTILKFAEKVMDKDSGIRYQLPFSLFGIVRKICVLREDIIDFCNMREVKTLILVSYMV
ncbi:uncharacterized protein E6C27_scaffold428G00700 [Cucumis melo var. makuwa]|uniref:Uncharacterized protein n=1 Tax=Cucumis melo var. makuwa TaxID=1194695 RepID=A0A5A7UCC5_CUCMM|nr:uncharacterized protein E6C27_scaffold428G00700 [Cucumis melo var. makuwa]